jgi:hypothetical protein
MGTPAGPVYIAFPLKYSIKEIVRNYYQDPPVGSLQVNEDIGNFSALICPVP